MTADAQRRLDLASAERVLVLDGAYGTQFRALDLPETAFRDAVLTAHPMPLKGNYELLSLTSPGIVRGLHDAYLDAGADVIETNSFNANRIIQEDYGLAEHAAEMARAGAAIARAAADAAMARNPARSRFVAGALGVTRRNPSRKGGDSPPGVVDVDDLELQAALAEAAGALIDGGVDLLLIETVTTTRNARLAVEAARRAIAARRRELPIVVSGTVNTEGRFESGESIDAFADALAGLELHALGLNCALAARELAPHAAALARRSRARIWLYPNAGYPDEAGRYREAAGETAAPLRAIAEQGLVNAIGACCGSTPAHIGALAQAMAGLRPRPVA